MAIVFAFSSNSVPEKARRGDVVGRVVGDVVGRAVGDVVDGIIAPHRSTGLPYPNVELDPPYEFHS